MTVIPRLSRTTKASAARNNCWPNTSFSANTGVVPAWIVPDETREF